MQCEHEERVGGELDETCCDCGASRGYHDDQWTIPPKVQELERRISELIRVIKELGPQPTPDGNAYCCLEGENLQDGIAGFGDTPEEAFNAWLEERISLMVDWKEFGKGCGKGEGK